MARPPCHRPRSSGKNPDPEKPAEREAAPPSKRQASDDGLLSIRAQLGTTLTISSRRFPEAAKKIKIQSGVLRINQILQDPAAGMSRSPPLPERMGADQFL